MTSNKPTYKEKNGTTRVGDALRFLAKTGKVVAPGLLTAASKITGISDLEELAIQISGEKKLTQEDKEFLLKELEYDIVVMQEITKRWVADAQSDSKASKNIRPYSFGATLIFTFIIVLLDSSFKWFSVKESWVDLLSGSLMLMIGAYYGFRTFEKVKKVAGKY